MTDPTIAHLLGTARERLSRCELELPLREAQSLLAALLGWSEAQILARDDRRVPPAVAARFEDLLGQRLAGRPMAYLLGKREFYGREFAVDERVLIPRPETEHLVEAVLGLELGARPRLLDIGTGSGCIAVTLKLERPRWRVAASDRSIAALAVARSNAAGLGAQVSFFAGDLGRSLAPSQIDVVVSNPPYIAERERADLSPEILEFEPGQALFAGVDGLDAYRELPSALARLDYRGWLALEVGYRQATAVIGLLEAAGFDSCSAIQDYAGIDRVVVARRS